MQPTRISHPKPKRNLSITRSAVNSYLSAISVTALPRAIEEVRRGFGESDLATNLGLLTRPYAGHTASIASCSGPWFPTDQEDQSGSCRLNKRRNPTEVAPDRPMPHDFHRGH